MNWKSVCNILTQKLCNPKEGAKLARARLKRLLDVMYRQEHRVGERLAVCLCIDLVTGAITRDQVVSALTSFKEDSGGILEAFAAAVESLGCRCNHIHDALTDSAYARVLNLRAFSSHYHEPSTPSATGDETELKLLRERLNSRSEEGYPMDAIDRTWCGSRPIVWVTRWTFINGIREQLGQQAATELNDIMGLGFDGDDAKRSLYVIRYPEQFPLTCKQPTTFDAIWDRPGYYLSYKKLDTWGLTHACSGHTQSSPEGSPPRLSAYTPLSKRT
jgi:hypothetical protein